MGKLFRLLCNYKIFTPIFFFIFVGLFSVDFAWTIKFIFFLYSAFILWGFYDALGGHDFRDNTTTRKGEEWRGGFKWLAVLSFCFILFSRLILFFRFGAAPLGYDTGFYIGAMKALIYPNSPTAAALYLLFTPFFSAGFSPAFLFHFFYILFQVFLVGSIYFLFRSFPSPFKSHFTSLVVALFSVSVVQFLAYWWAFAQQMLAMGFFFITIAFFLRGSLVTILTGIFALLLHTSTGVVLFLSFFLFYLVYGVQLLFKKRYYNARTTQIFAVGLLLMPVIFFLKKNDLSNIFSDVWGQYGFLLKNIPEVWLYAFRGLFIIPDAMRLLEIGIIPFSILTVLHPVVWMRQHPDKSFFYRNLLILYCSLSVLIPVTFLPVIYQSRSSIILDLMFLIFAVPSLLLFIEYFLRERVGRFLLVFLIVFFVWNMGLHVWQQGPMISSKELNEIKSIPTLIGPGAGILATDSLYAPWLWGFVGPNTVSPGYLGDSWSLETWNRFWSGNNNEERLRLLQTRDHPQPPMYIYIGESQRLGLPFEKFIRTAPQFQQITPHLWKFIDDPRQQP